MSFNTDGGEKGKLTAGQTDTTDDKTTPKFRLHSTVDIDGSRLCRRSLQHLRFLFEQVLKMLLETNDSGSG